jgi:uncharacterized SAM-binding protein YcdF (DUF218 family)
MNLKQIAEITEYIFLPSRPCVADVALVFGTRYTEPIDKVYELYSNGLVRKIVVSGGTNKNTGENEAHTMSARLQDKGVPPDDILVEPVSTNSLENVLFSRDVIADRLGFASARRVLAVVKHYHSRRAMMTLKKHFPESVECFPVTYEAHGFTREDWYKSEEGRRHVLSEWEKIPVYLQKGDIDELSIV